MVEWRKESETRYQSGTVNARSGSSQWAVIGPRDQDGDLGGVNLSSNTVYKVRVTAGAGTPVSYGDPSDDVTVRMPVELTQKPVIAVTPGDKALTVTWDAIAGANDYCIRWAPRDTTVWRGEDSCRHGDPNVFLASERRSYKITSYNGAALKNGTEYVVQALARNDAHSGPWSDVETATPVGKPADPVISLTGGDTIITVAWEADANATGHEIQWRTTEQSYGAGGRTANVEAKDGTEYVIDDLTNGTKYMVRVRASNAAGVSDWSNGEATAGPAAPAEPDPEPSAPTGSPVVEASAGDASVTLTWKTVADATKYKVQWRSLSQNYGAADREAEVTEGTTHTVTPLENGTEYMFRAMAGNAAGYGPASGDVSATPMAVEEPEPEPGRTGDRACGPGCGR